MFWRREKKERPEIRWVLRMQMRNGKHLNWVVTPLSEEEEKKFWKGAQQANDGWFRYDNTLIRMGDISTMMLDKAQ